METPVGSEDSSILGDFIEDENVVTPLDAASRELLRDQIRNALLYLNERERQVLELRFGLLDGRDHTLEEVGQRLGVTRERVRQIEAKALRKLRHPRSQPLAAGLPWIEPIGWSSSPAVLCGRVSRPRVYSDRSVARTQITAPFRGLDTAKPRATRPPFLEKEMNMAEAIEVAPGIYWIGVNDRTTDLFEGMWPIAREGVSYNAYLIKDEKLALIDLAKAMKAEDLLRQIDALADVRRAGLRRDQPHGTRPHRRPAAGAAAGAATRRSSVPRRRGRCWAHFTVSPTASASCTTARRSPSGNHELKFFETPFVHWPETMMTWATPGNVLFSCDGFGGIRRAGRRDLRRPARIGGVLRTGSVAVLREHRRPLRTHGAQGDRQAQPRCRSPSSLPRTGWSGAGIRNGSSSSTKSGRVIRWVRTNRKSRCCTPPCTAPRRR